MFGVLILHFITFTAAVATDGKPLRQPIVNRGAKAWGNYDSKDPYGFSVANRLLVHAITDGSNKQYLKEVRIFCQRLKMHGKSFQNVQQLDKLLSKECEIRCYGLEQQFGCGKNLLYGILTIWPDLKDGLPRARRALAAWERNVLSTEGKPFWVGTIYAMIENILSRGKLFQALTLWLSYDLYCRESGWESLRMGSIHVVHANNATDAPEVAMAFGGRQWGKGVKTGFDQSVNIEDPTLRRFVSMLKEETSDSEIFIPFDQAFYRKEWNKTVYEYLQLGDAGGPPHSA